MVDLSTRSVFCHARGTLQWKHKTIKTTKILTTKASLWGHKIHVFFFQRQESSVSSQTNAFKQKFTFSDRGLKSFLASFHIASCKLSHMIGENFLLPTVRDIVHELSGENATIMVNIVPISNNTVNRKITWYCRGRHCATSKASEKQWVHSSATGREHRCRKRSTVASVYQIYQEEEVYWGYIILQTHNA